MTPNFRSLLGDVSKRSQLLRTSVIVVIVVVVVYYRNRGKNIVIILNCANRERKIVFEREVVNTVYISKLEK